MTSLESFAARARRTLPAAAALVLLACLVIAAAWSASETARAAEEVRRSSVTLVQLAKLRAALAEARLAPPRDDTDTPRSSQRQARRTMRTLERLDREAARADRESFAQLESLVRERVTTSSPDRAALLDDEIERRMRARESLASKRLEQATRRLVTRGRQTLFLIAANGLLALGAAALALRPRTAP